jgi:protein phosphatase
MLLLRPSWHGPFDIVGDVHGCLNELLDLMAALGYRVERQRKGFAVSPPHGRKLAFVGDLVNRGPATPAVLRLVMSMVHAGNALSVPGNQDMKLVAMLKGSLAQPTPGLARSLEQFAAEPAEFPAAVIAFFEALPNHCVLDARNLVIAHAGLPQSMQGSHSARARAFALSGETTGETDEFGLAVRCNWAADYRGKALVVFGHTPVPQPLWLNNTVNIDTGCVYGGQLTALRYPERETVSVRARAVYSASRRRFPPNQALARQSALERDG